jgi:hypothetical protein
LWMRWARGEEREGVDESGMVGAVKDEVQGGVER